MRAEGPEEGGCELQAGFLQLRGRNEGIKEALKLSLSKVLKKSRDEYV